MTVRNTGVVDKVGIERSSGAVMLIVVDDEAWSDVDEHLGLLREKLNSYLRYVESGEYLGTFQSAGTVAPSGPVKVKILARYHPPEQAQVFLENATATFRDAGFELTHEVIEVPEP